MGGVIGRVSSSLPLSCNRWRTISYEAKHEKFSEGGLGIHKHLLTDVSDVSVTLLLHIRFMTKKSSLSTKACIRSVRHPDSIGARVSTILLSRCDVLSSVIAKKGFTSAGSKAPTF